MNPRIVAPAALRRLLPCFFTAWLLLGATGCVSSKFKRTEKPTAPVELNLHGKGPSLDAVLRNVIIFQGPGSWKREAYWDEYILLLLNHGSTTLIVESVTIIDVLDQARTPGIDPWELEKQSREILRQYERNAGRIAAGIGLGVVWGVSPVIAAGAAYAGSGTIALASTATFFVLPAVAVTSLVMRSHAKRDIADEFARRQLALPLALQPDDTRQGSLFFPVSAGPKRLIIAGTAGAERFTLEIELAPLAGLHLKTPKAAASAN